MGSGRGALDKRGEEHDLRELGSPASARKVKSPREESSDDLQKAKPLTDCKMPDLLGSSPRGKGLLAKGGQ